MNTPQELIEILYTYLSKYSPPPQPQSNSSTPYNPITAVQLKQTLCAFKILTHEWKRG